MVQTCISFVNAHPTFCAVLGAYIFILHIKIMLFVAWYIVTRLNNDN